MVADRKRNRLWVAEVFGKAAPGQTGPNRSSVLEVELSSGRALSRHPAPSEDGNAPTLGDVAMAADGSVYASDSTGGGVYRLPPGGGALRLFARTGLRSPQGLVPSRDGKALLLLDSSGLHRLDLATAALTPLAGDGARLRGLDGLVRSGADLIATRNGASPNRILRLRLAPGEKAVASVETLAEDPARLDDIALGAIIGRRFVFVAHSQWSAVGRDGQVKPDGVPATLSWVDLGKNQFLPGTGRNFQFRGGWRR
jgi:hypothetical protein